MSGIYIQCRDADGFAKVPFPERFSPLQDCPLCPDQFRLLIKGLCKTCYYRHWKQGTLNDHIDPNYTKPPAQYLVYSLHFYDFTVYYGMTLDLKQRLYAHISKKNVVNKAVTRRIHETDMLHHVRIHRIFDTQDEAHAFELECINWERACGTKTVLNQEHTPPSFALSKPSKSFGTYRCRICHESYPVDMFYADQRTSGLSNKCKDCVNKWHRFRNFANANGFKHFLLWPTYREHYNLSVLDFFMLPVFEGTSIQKKIIDHTYEPTKSVPKTIKCHDCEKTTVKPGSKDRWARGLCGTCYAKRKWRGTLNLLPKTRAVIRREMRELPKPRTATCWNCLQSKSTKHMERILDIDNQFKYLCMPFKEQIAAARTKNHN